MLFAFIGFIVLKALFAYVFAIPSRLGETGIWYGEATANILMVIIAGLYFLHGTWTETVIDPPDRDASSVRRSGSDAAKADNGAIITDDCEL